MSTKVGTIAKIESIVAMFLASSMIPSLLIALFNKESQSMHAFLTVILLCVVFGLIIFSRNKLSRYNFKNRDGFLIVSLTFFVAIVIGALPYWFSGICPSFVDAVFESTSGFSTTGATIFQDVEALPKSILFWRSLTQWIGGLAVLIFLTAIAPAFALDTQTIAYNETGAPIQNKLTSHFSNYSKQIYIIYILLTVIEILLLWISGMSLFDSFIHSFSTISTGGFSSYNDGIAHFNNGFVKLITAAFMLIAALDIGLYFLAKKRGVKEVFKDEETRFYITIIIVFGLIIGLYNFVMNGFHDFMGTFGDTYYQVISIITTTGQVASDYNIWPTFSKFSIFALFFVGGCSSSIGGGITCVRVRGGFKMIRRGIYSRLHPNIISPVTFNHQEVSNEAAIRLSNFIFTYFVMIVCGTLLISFSGFDFMTNFSAATSCLGNIGPGFNEVGPTMNYSNFNDFSKLICSFLMVTGRVELYSVLVLFSRNYWNPNKLR